MDGWVGSVEQHQTATCSESGGELLLPQMLTFFFSILEEKIVKSPVRSFGSKS